MANEEADLYLTELRKLRGAAKDPDVVRALSGEIDKLERARSLAEIREIQSAAKNPHVLSLLSSEIEKLEKKQEVVSGSVRGVEVKKEMLMSMDNQSQPPLQGRVKKVAVRNKGKRRINKNRAKASWDTQKHAVFVNICLEELQAGNKPGQSLNKEGYSNLARKFLERTGISYERDQFKNHWDNTRKDWKIWKALQSETNLEFNEEKKTYEMPDDWWDQFTQRHPGGDKFRNFPLAFENELDTLFSSTAARGESVHMPRSSTHDVHEEDNTNIKVDESPCAFGESHEGPDSSPFQSYTADQSFTAGSQYMGTDIGRDNYSPSPTSAMPRPCLTMKRIKSSANQKWEKSLDRVCELIELRTKHAMMVSAQTENIPTIAESIAMLRDMQIIPCHAEQWSFAASLLREQENRVLFLELGDEEHRARWICLEYQMAMGNRGQ